MADRHLDENIDGREVGPDIRWEDVALFPDCAFAALGDASMVDDQRWLKGFRQHAFVRQPHGLGMVYGLAECDDLPVEIGRTGSHVIAARLEFTSDVADVAAGGSGSWKDVGRLRIAEEGAIAVDMKMRHETGWVHRLPLPAGWYTAQVFLMDWRVLGIRLMADAPNAKDEVAS